MATHAFTASTSDELSLTVGAQLKVLDRSQEPWWKVALLSSGATGFIPSAFVEPRHTLHGEL